MPDNFFLAKGSKAEAAQQRKAANGERTKNARKGSLVKTGKSKPGGKKGKFDVGGGLTSGKKSKKKDEDEDEEILSDASDVVGKEGGPPDAGYSSDEDGGET